MRIFNIGYMMMSLSGFVHGRGEEEATRDGSAVPICSVVNGWEGVVWGKGEDSRMTWM